MKCHPVFHVSLLEPTAINPLKRQNPPPPPPIVVNNEHEYKAKEVVDSKPIRKKTILQSTMGRPRSR